MPRARVTSSVLSSSKDGKDMLIITFDVDGQSIPYYLLFESEKNMEFAEKDLTTLGWNPLKNGWDITQINGTSRLVDVECDVTLEDTVWNNKPQKKIKYLGRRAADDGQVSTLVAKLRARAGLPPKSDDIPF